MYEKAVEDKTRFIQKGLKDYSSKRNYDLEKTYQIYQSSSLIGLSTNTIL